jgi:protein-disulfide isomerase
MEDKTMQTITRFIKYLSVIMLLLVQLPLLAADTTSAPPQSISEKLASQILTDLAHKPAAFHPQGKITLLEFFDYRCSDCRKSLPQLQTMVQAQPNVKLVYVEYPKLGDDSVYATKAVYAAQEQGKYIQFHDALMTNKKPLTANEVMALAQQQQLEMSKFTTAMQDPKVSAELKQTLKIADALKVQFVPTYFIANSQAPHHAVLVTTDDMSSLQKIVSDMQKKA